MFEQIVNQCRLVHQTRRVWKVINDQINDQSSSKFTVTNEISGAYFCYLPASQTFSRLQHNFLEVFVDNADKSPEKEEVDSKNWFIFNIFSQGRTIHYEGLL